jgi:hypothetical protein
LKGCVCDGRSEGPTKAVLSTRKLKQVKVQVTRHSPRAALTPQVGRISSLPRFFCALEAQEQFSARISTFSCCWQPFLLRSRQQRFFSLRGGEKSKKRKLSLAPSLCGGGPNVFRKGDSDAIRVQWDTHRGCIGGLTRPRGLAAVYLSYTPLTSYQPPYQAGQRVQRRGLAVGVAGSAPGRGAAVRGR